MPEPLERKVLQTAYCLTVYNEPGVAILTSLASLVNTIAYQQKRDPTPRNGNIFIIADGQEKISDSALLLFRELRLFSGEHNRLSSGSTYTLHSFDHRDLLELIRYTNQTDSIEGTNSWSEIYQQSLQGQQADTTGSVEFKPSLSITLFIKDFNQGKLNSHWWFFNHFCRQVNPDHCIQMDAGTASHRNALHILQKTLEADPTLGALASRVQTLKPYSPTNILLAWQYADFFVQKILDWPAEVLSGYLTVIPGQFSIVRWSALSEAESNKEPTPNSTLGKYFRGLGPLSPMEGNMFLAEDRVLGFEIISKKIYNIGYAIQAEATTDTCQSLSELMHQRRRWINSSFTCNLHATIGLIRNLKGRSAEIGPQCKTIAAISWLAITGLVQWFMPAQMCILLVFLTSTTTPPNPPVSPLLLVFILTIAVQITTFASDKLSEKAMSKVAAITTLIQGGLVASSVISFSSVDRIIAVSWLQVAWLAFIYAAAGITATGKSTRPSKILLCYPLLTPFYMLTLNTYAVCNCNDLSWGTKGLTKNENKKPNLFRAKALSLWLACNIAAILLYVHPNSPIADAIGRSSYLLIAIYTLFKGLSGLTIAVKTRVQSARIALER